MSYQAKLEEYLKSTSKGINEILKTNVPRFSTAKTPELKKELYQDMYNGICKLIPSFEEYCPFNQFYGLHTNTITSKASNASFLEFNKNNDISKNINLDVSEVIQEFEIPYIDGEINKTVFVASSNGSFEESEDIIKVPNIKTKKMFGIFAENEDDLKLKLSNILSNNSELENLKSQVELLNQQQIQTTDTDNTLHEYDVAKVLQKLLNGNLTVKNPNGDDEISLSLTDTIDYHTTNKHYFDIANDAVRDIYQLNGLEYITVEEEVQKLIDGKSQTVKIPKRKMQLTPNASNFMKTLFTELVDENKNKITIQSIWFDKVSNLLSSSLHSWVKDTGGDKLNIANDERFFEYFINLIGSVNNELAQKGYMTVGNDAWQPEVPSNPFRERPNHLSSLANTFQQIVENPQVNNSGGYNFENVNQPQNLPGNNEPNNQDPAQLDVEQQRLLQNVVEIDHLFTN